MPALKREKTKYPGVFVVQGTSIANGKPEDIYYIRYRKNGKPIEEKAGRQYQDDMTAAKAAYIRASRINGSDPTNKEHREQKETQKKEIENKWPMNRLFELFKENKSNLKSLKVDISRYQIHINPVIGNKEVHEISPFDISRISIGLQKTHKPATVKQVLVLIKRIINFGENWGVCPHLSFKIEMPKVNNQKTEDLSPTQLKSLLLVLDESKDIQAANLMKLALYTGLRRSELFRLKWNHIDFEKGFIKVYEPKGGKNQIIPLNSNARTILGKHPHSESDYVFPGRFGEQRDNITKAVNKIKKDAGLPADFRPLHGLRHVFASMLASSGQVDMYTLQKLLTHKSPLMTQRYAHLRDETLKQASNLMGELVEQAISQKQENQKAG